jgi:hypothetical protein
MAAKLLLNEPAEMAGTELELEVEVELVDVFVVVEELPHPAMTAPADNATMAPRIHLNLTMHLPLSLMSNQPRCRALLAPLRLQSQAPKSISVNRVPI